MNDLKRKLAKSIFMIKTVMTYADFDTALKVYHSCFLAALRYSILF